MEVEQFESNLKTEEVDSENESEGEHEELDGSNISHPDVNPFDFVSVKMEQELQDEHEDLETGEISQSDPNTFDFEFVKVKQETEREDDLRGIEDNNWSSEPLANNSITTEKMLSSVQKIMGGVNSGDNVEQVHVFTVRDENIVKNLQIPSYELTKGLGKSDGDIVIRVKEEIPSTEASTSTDSHLDCISPMIFPEYDSDIDPEYLPSADVKEEIVSDENTYGDEEQNEDTTSKGDTSKKINSQERNSIEDPTCKSKRNKVRCLYCDSSVDNFARHLTRNHGSELEVQRFMSIDKNKIERKQIIAELRKKGNFSLNVNDCVRPVKKPCITRVTDCQPCEYCLGFYSGKYLWRHKKSCSQKNAGSIPNKNILYSNRTDPELISQVFPHMRPDKVSRVAKKDPLICAFASKYMKCHREKHFISVTSRKMRELAKLLIEIMKIEPKVKNLIDALQPQYYDVIVQATKVVAQYREADNTFMSPTYVMNIKKSLKDCCDISINFVLKKKHVYQSLTAAETESELKTTVTLLDNNWLFDISKPASKQTKILKKME